MTSAQINRCRRIQMPFAPVDAQDYDDAETMYYPAHEPFEKVCAKTDMPNYIPPLQGRFKQENFGEEFTPIGFERHRRFVEPLERETRSYNVPGSNMVVYHDVSFWRDILAIIGIGYIIKMLYEMWNKK